MPKLSTYPEVTPQSGDLIAITRGGKNYNYDYDSLRRKNIDVVVVAVAAAPAINTDDGDIFTITGLSLAITSLTTNLTGTPAHGEMIMIQITDNGTSRAIAHGAKFVSTSDATMFTATTANKKLTELFQWDSTAAVWECIGATEQL